MKKTSWFFDKKISQTPKIGIRIKEKIYSKKSSFQKIEVMDTEPYGRILVLDKSLL